MNVRLRSGFALIGTILAGFVAVILPIGVSYEIARRQSVAYQIHEVEVLANEIGRRADETAAQIAAARDDLNSGRYGAPCSAAEISQMRSLAMSSIYLQALGRVEGDHIPCSSFGRPQPPLRLGRPSFKTKNGVRMWLYISPPLASAAKFHIAESNGVCAFIAPDLALDVFSDYSDQCSAIIAAESKQLISSRGEVRQEWIDRLGDQASVTFVDRNYVVGIRRSSRTDLLALAAVPTRHIYKRQGDAALILVPLGAIIGLVLALGVVKSAQKQHTLPYVLRSAIKNREFFMNYQPVVDLQTGEVVGAEALIRWRRVTGELVRPDLFIEAAEDAGLIRKITDIVIDLVVHDVAKIHAVKPGFMVSLNFSPEDIKTTRAAERLISVATQAGLDVETLVVEITETGLLAEEQFEAVELLRNAGISVAMDDFGTGYSSMATLMKLEVDRLKIDRLFVDAIGMGSATSQVVSHMIEMAQSLQLSVTAEGVETQEQGDYLKERGVQYAQGFHYGKPMSLDDLISLP